MTHYQKIALILIRVLCLVGFLFSLIGFCYSILIGLFSTTHLPETSITFYSSVFYFIFSVIVFILSKLIAKFLCMGIKNNYDE